MANHHRTLGGGGGSRDLLRHFSASGIGGDESPTGEDDSGEIELSLGLSLGGSFGVDPRANRLVRSSSTNVACSLAPSLSARDVEEEEERRRRQALIRTCSLPVAADEEDDRKRRAGLVLGPGEAKRRRDMDGDGWGFVSGPWGGGVPPAATAANTTKNGGDGGGLPKFPGRNGGVISFENGQLQAEKKSHQPPSHHSQPTPPRPALSPQSAKGSSRGVAAPPLTSQGSLGSQGSSLTAATPDSESRHTTQGYGQHVNSMDLSTVQPSTDRGIESAASIFPGSSLVSNNSGHVGEKPGGSSRSNGSLVMDRVIGDNMPSVFTKGDGPNGKIVEGFLYKYKKVEEVRIVCVCHGIFLTPAEFIKHAGGTDVAHPLRHIVVKPSASLL